MPESGFEFQLDDLLDFHEADSETGIPGTTAMDATLREHGKNEGGKLLKTTAADDGYSEAQFSVTNMGQAMMGTYIYKDQDIAQEHQQYLLSALQGDTISREDTKGKLGGNFDDQVPLDVKALSAVRIQEKGLFPDPNTREDSGKAEPAKPPTSGEPPAVPENPGNLNLVTENGTTLAKEFMDVWRPIRVAAIAAGFAGIGGGGYRSQDQQIKLRIAHCGGDTHHNIWEKKSSQCSPPTAIPGHSRHERGTAIDITENGGSISSGLSSWLKAHQTANFKNLPSEKWHYSIDGS